MFNPASSIYQEIDEYNKQMKNSTIKKDTRKGLLKRGNLKEESNSMLNKKQPLQEVADIVLKIREQNPKYNNTEEI